MVTSTFSRSSSARLTPRSPAVHRRWPVSSVAVSFSLASFLLAALCILYLFSVRHSPALSTFAAVNITDRDRDRDRDGDGDGERCDVFAGAWVKDGGYPLYNSTECPFAERGFNCLANGREDTDYLKWRWKPRRCEVPRFDARGVLESLRGKRVVFVGDSMSRTQWESLICMLMTGVEDRGSVVEVNGNVITKTIRFLGVEFRGFNLSVEFFRSVFIVQQGLAMKGWPRRVKTVLKLDKMDDINRDWADSDVLIFNSGHWWTPAKLFDVGCYFQAGGSLKLGMPITSAFRVALETWASWVETTVDTNRTQVFFRTFEPSHWSGSKQKACEVTHQPMSEISGAIPGDRIEFVDIITDVVAKMRVPVTVLNVTSMVALRSDAHIGAWSHPSPTLDCSHWCLPGVPDAWNELVFSYLLKKGWRNLGR